MEIGQFIVGVTTSTVAATFLGQIIIWFRERSQRKDSAKLSALILIKILEQYCIDCSIYLADIEAADDYGHGHQWTTLPTLLKFPTDTDWKALGIIHAEKLFGFRSELDASQRLISDAYLFDPPDGGDGRVAEELPSSGIKAHKLAQYLRNQFSINKHLNSEALVCLDRLKKSQKAREQRLAAWHEQRQTVD